MKKYTVTLTDEEIKQLQDLSSKGKHAAQKILNALILLNCDESQGAGRHLSQREIAEVLKVSERKIEGYVTVKCGNFPKAIARTLSEELAWWLSRERNQPR